MNQEKLSELSWISHNRKQDANSSLNATQSTTTNVQVLDWDNDDKFFKVSANGKVVATHRSYLIDDSSCQFMSSDVTAQNELLMRAHKDDDT